MMTADVFTTEIIKDAIVALGEEMFNAMIRTSMSPITKLPTLRSEPQTPRATCWRKEMV